MNLEHVAEQIAKQLSALNEVEEVAREDPEPLSLSESSADIFVKRLIVTWEGGARYQVEIRPTY
jgi:hypothetical protein